MSGSRGEGHVPEMSVVIVIDAMPHLRKVLRGLAAQTVSERLELVLVTPCDTRVDLDSPELQGVHAVQHLSVERLESLSWARLPGIRASRAPIVALAESHSYHDPEWAEALIDAHRGPWAAVGPSVGNANPTHPVSWANFLLDYGPWFNPEGPGEAEDVPGHNSSYKRELLDAYDDSELAGLLEQETFLHADLRARGHRLWVEPRARMRHLNVTRVSSWFRERVAAGQRFAAARSLHWSRSRRLLYVVAAPAIPLVRLVRTTPILRRVARSQGVPRLTFPATIVALLFNTAGEVLGYLGGRGDSMERLSRIELDKTVHVTIRERRVLEV